MNVQLHCGDCLEYMRGLPDKAIDLVLTDPPYGIKITRNAKLVGVATYASRRATADAWDDAIPHKEYFDEIKRISRQQIVFGANYFWEHFYSSQCYIVWDKRGGLPDVPFCPTEFAWTSFVDKPSKQYVVRNHGFIRDADEQRTGHPTQKPVKLMIAILRDFSRPGDLVFDPFAGSGSTAVACIQTQRRFLGCEISPLYHAIAKRRIEQAQMQLALPLEIA